jgi:hypothetical protein
MTGPGSDPRLLGAAWANEERLAAGQGDAASARQHRAEDYDAAKSRPATHPARLGLRQRLARLFRRGR